MCVFLNGIDINLAHHPQQIGIKKWWVYFLGSVFIYRMINKDY